MTGRRGRFLVLVLVLFSFACHQSPLVPFVRAVDQGASWAAAIRYAHGLESQHAVPHAYLQKIVTDGAVEANTARAAVVELKEIPDELKQQALTLYDGLMAELNAARTNPRAIDVTRLAQHEAGFRALAKMAGAR